MQDAIHCLSGCMSPEKSKTELLNERASKFKQIAARLELLAQKQAELDREEMELEQWITPSSPTVDEQPKIISMPRARPSFRQTSLPLSLSKSSHEDSVMEVLKAYGPLKHQDIWNRIQERRLNGPKSAAGLSPLLSRMKSSGKLVLNDWHWSIPTIAPVAPEEPDPIMEL